MSMGDDVPGVPSADLSAVVVPLLKGVTYRNDDAAHWHALLQLQARVRDHVGVLGLDLTLDEAEGYAFLRSRPEPEDPTGPKLPRLVARRPLLAVAAGDERCLRGDGRGDHMIVIRIVGNCARHGGGRDQRHQRRIARHQLSTLVPNPLI
jgi:hypothetical protein